MGGIQLEESNWRNPIGGIQLEESNWRNPIGVLKNAKINDFLERQQTLVFLCGFLLQKRQGNDYDFKYNAKINSEQTRKIQNEFEPSWLNDELAFKFFNLRWNKPLK
jgi:hypothetical protein